LVLVLVLAMMCSRTVRHSLDFSKRYQTEQ
jgi:hypothetical protein